MSQKLFRGPQLALTALYVAVISATLRSDSPPLSFTSILLAALTLVIIGHLKNVYEVGDVLAEKYPATALALDLLLALIFALSFQLLTHPLAGGLGQFPSLCPCTWLPPWLTGTEFVNFLTGGAVLAGSARDQQVRMLLAASTHRAFSVLAIAPLVLGLWHWVMTRKKIRSPKPKSPEVRSPELEPPRLRWYIAGWILFELYAIFGLCLTAHVPLTDEAVARLTTLALVALVSAGGFILITNSPENRYREKKDESGKVTSPGPPPAQRPGP